MGLFPRARASTLPEGPALEIDAEVEKRKALFLKKNRGADQFGPEQLAVGQRIGQPPKWLPLGLDTWDGSTCGPISWWLNFLTHTQLTENDSQVEGLGPEAKHQRLGAEMDAVDRGIV